MYFPTLSEDSWVTDNQQMLDYLISHFFLSDYSQTQIYLNNVSSLPFIIQSETGDIRSTVKAIEDNLIKYLNRYFTTASVEITEKVSNSSKTELTFFVSVYDENNKEYNLSKIIEISNSKISNIINISNG